MLNIYSREKENRIFHFTFCLYVCCWVDGPNLDLWPRDTILPVDSDYLHTTLSRVQQHNIKLNNFPFGGVNSISYFFLFLKKRKKSVTQNFLLVVDCIIITAVGIGDIRRKEDGTNHEKTWRPNQVVFFFLFFLFGKNNKKGRPVFLDVFTYFYANYASTLIAQFFFTTKKSCSSS